MIDKSAHFPESHHDILLGKNFAQVAMVMPDGRLSNNTVAFIWDGTHVSFSTTKSRQKYKTLMKDPRIAICISDLKNPLRYLEIRGDVISQEDQDRAFINGIAKKYMDMDQYPYDKPGEERVTFRVIHARVRAENLSLG